MFKIRLKTEKRKEKNSQLSRFLCSTVPLKVNLGKVRHLFLHFSKKGLSSVQRVHAVHDLRVIRTRLKYEGVIQS